jgi:hypothetical protein
MRQASPLVFSGNARAINYSQNDGGVVYSVNPLVRTTGYEIGLRSDALKGWQTTLAPWQLNMDSELLFVGDAGTTEPSRPSRRYGVEWTNFYVPFDWLAFDADLAWSHARFSENSVDGNYIPGAVMATANLGVTIDNSAPGSARCVCATLAHGH